MHGRNAGVKLLSWITAMRRLSARMRRGIGLRLLLRVLVFSSVVTLILTVFELYLDYRYDVDSIEYRLSEIDVSYRQSMSAGLWNLDRQQIQLQADGILSQPSIRYVEVRELTDREAPILVSAGVRQDHAMLTRTIPLYYTFHGVRRQLGVLVVEATLDDVYRSLLHRISVILVSQAAKTFLVSFFILYITYLLITRHLVTLARFLANYDLREGLPGLTLKRRPLQEKDELDQLVSAFESMRSNLERVYGDLSRREEDYRGIYENALEGIARVSPDGRILSANPACARMFGFDHAEALVAGTSDFARQCWRDPGEWNRLVMRLREDGFAVGHEVELVRRGGQYVWGLLSARAVQREPRELIFIETIISDVTARKQIETALRESEQRFRDYAQTASDWFWESDAEHTIVYLSDRFRTFSDRLERVVGRHRWEFADDLDSEPEKWRIHREILDRREPFRDFVYRVRRDDGTMNFLSISGTPVWNADGGFRGYRGVTCDVTQRVNAEEDRRANLSFFTGMDRVNRAIQGASDLDGMMHDVLETVRSIFGCDHAWLVYPCDPHASTWRAFMEKTEPASPGAFASGTAMPVDSEVAAIFGSVLDSQEAVRFGPGLDCPLPVRIAGRFDIKSMMGMALYPKLDLPYMFGLHQRTHGRTWSAHEKRLFRAIGRRLGDALTSLITLRNLIDSEARLESAQRIAQVGYWERDLETGNVSWSKQTWRIAGANREQPRMSVALESESIHPEDRERVAQAVERAVNGDSRFVAEYRLIRPGNEVRYVQSQGDVQFDGRGRAVKMFGAIQDVTERKLAEMRLSDTEKRYREMQTALAHANRLATLGQVSAEIAHEVKQPITAAAANAAAAARWLGAQPPNFDEAKRALGSIVDNAMLASAVIARIRRLVTRGEVDMVPLSVNEAIQEVVAVIQGEAEKHDVSISLKLSPALPEIHGDRVQLQQVILNLVINAIEALRDFSGPRQVVVSTSKEPNGGVSVSVQDSGPGLSQDILKSVFEPFFTTKPDGMGMGLAICHSIVAACGGRIWAGADSHHGATFHVVFPPNAPAEPDTGPALALS